MIIHAKLQTTLFSIAIVEADVRLQQATLQVNEGVGIVDIVVLLTGTLEVPVTVK